MAKMTNLIIDGIKLDLAVLAEIQRRPRPFAPGEPLFWDDPHISQQMLAAHLTPQADAASRRHQIIDLEVAWLIVALHLGEGMSAIDLGCGPGLYASGLAQRRVRVTGVDYSHLALAYARDYARAHELDVTYVYQDYLTLAVESRFDAALLANGDFCALSPEDRRKLLGNIYHALKPGGRFALDVITPRFQVTHQIENRWYVAEHGFWREERHLVLEEGFGYPREEAFVNQYTIIEEDGTATIYRNWFQTYSPTTIIRELEESGFLVEVVGANLRGDAYTDASEWIGIVAQKSPALAEPPGG